MTTGWSVLRLRLRRRRWLVLLQLLSVMVILAVVTQRDAGAVEGSLKYAENVSVSRAF